MSEKNINSKTPKEIETEKNQARFEAQVSGRINLLLIDVQNPDLTEADRAFLYRAAQNIRSHVDSCSLPIKKEYNKMITELFKDMDIIPGSMLFSTDDLSAP